MSYNLNLREGTSYKEAYEALHPQTRAAQKKKWKQYQVLRRQTTPLLLRTKLINSPIPILDWLKDRWNGSDPMYADQLSLSEEGTVLPPDPPLNTAGEFDTMSALSAVDNTGPGPVHNPFTTSVEEAEQVASATKARETEA